MFSLGFRRKKPSILDQAIEDLAMEMRHGWTAELPQQAATLKTLMEAKAAEPKEKVSSNTLAAIAGNLIGITMILMFERKNVIGNTKALGFIPKIHT